MDASFQSLLTRISVVERQNRQFRTGLVVLCVLVLIALAVSKPDAQRSADPLRVRGLIIEDGNVQPRVTIGAPLPVDGRAANVRTGIRINDPNGAERFAFTFWTTGAWAWGSMRRPEKAMTESRANQHRR
jgi:hypothetical protein